MLANVIKIFNTANKPPSTHFDEVPPVYVSNNRDRIAMNTTVGSMNRHFQQRPAADVTQALQYPPKHPGMVSLNQ